jgi:hypothetical protein
MASQEIGPGVFVRCIDDTQCPGGRVPPVVVNQIYKVQSIRPSRCKRDGCSAKVKMVGVGGFGCVNRFVPIRPQGEELLSLFKCEPVLEDA